MRPHRRRRIYLAFVPVAWAVMPVTWVLQQVGSPVIRFTYPVLFAF